MQRISSLRKLALEQGSYHQEFHYHFYKAYADLADLPEYARYGEAFYTAFSKLTPFIYDGELIVGNSGRPLSETEDLEWRSQYDILNQVHSFHLGQDSHMAIDYELLLSEGVHGIIRRFDTYAQNCPIL